MQEKGRKWVNIMEMAVVELVMGILLLVLSLGIVVAVMLQSGKDKKLSGAIVGGSDTFFGKGKTGRKDRTLRILTTVLSTVFFVLIVALYCIAGN